MLHVFLGASEPSKVPFYFAGGALVVWALVLAAIGLSRPDFPNNANGQRGVIGITTVLVVIAIGAAILTSP